LEDERGNKKSSSKEIRNVQKDEKKDDKKEKDNLIMVKKGKYKKVS
jgi:hypothetical protein